MTDSGQMSMAILGASGYGGVEFLRLAAAHPHLKVTYCAGHTSAGERLGALYPHLPAPLADIVLGELDVEKAAHLADILVFCLPHTAAMDMMVAGHEMGKTVVDFSADFRLKSVADYERYYQVSHTQPEHVHTAVYGLPELHRDEILGSRFIAVPGCYPTSVILALAPAVAAGLIATDTIIADSKSGVSGAGRKTGLGTHFSEITESFTAYGIAKHRHTPEMDQELGALARDGAGPVQVTFVPHLVPQIRGILSTCYATLTDLATVEQIHSVYADFYAEEPFVRLLEPGDIPATKHVTGTNRCDIGIAMDERAGRLIVVSAVDNLIKGLSGAALQCINLACGWDETTALPVVAQWP